MSHDQKRYVAYQFNGPYLRKKLLPSRMLVASCDTDTDPSGIM